MVSSEEVGRVKVGSQSQFIAIGLPHVSVFLIEQEGRGLNTCSKFEHLRQNQFYLDNTAQVQGEVGW